MVQAFEDLKKALILAPCLQILDLDKDFEVTTNASEDAKTISCVLTQNEHPVAFDSNLAAISPWKTFQSLHRLSFLDALEDTITLEPKTNPLA